MSGGLDERLVKKAYKKEKYSDEQLLELAKCADKESGPLYFMENFLYVQHATRGKIKFSPYEYQKKMVECFNQNKYSILLCSRQQGKCVFYNENIRLRNKVTGEYIEICIGDFMEAIKDGSM